MKIFSVLGKYSRFRAVLLLLQYVVSIIGSDVSDLNNIENELKNIVNEDKDIYNAEPDFLANFYRPSGYVEEDEVVVRSSIIVPKKSSEGTHAANIREMSVGYSPNSHGTKKSMNERPTASIVTVTTKNTTNSANFTTENLKSSLENLDKAAAGAFKKAKLSTAVLSPNSLNTSMTALISNSTKPLLKSDNMTENRTESSKNGEHTSLINSTLDISSPVIKNSFNSENMNSSLTNSSSVDSKQNESSKSVNQTVSSAPLLQNQSASDTILGNDSLTQRDSKPSVITDSHIKGFLAKSEDFTIKDVGQNGTKNGSGHHDQENSSESSPLKPLNVTGFPAGYLNQSLTNTSNSNATPGSNESFVNTGRDNQANNFGYQQYNNTKILSSNEKRMLHIADLDDFVKKHVEATPEAEKRIPSLEVVRDVTGTKKEIVGPGYYEYECDEKKKCPDGKYCRGHVCVDCHRLHHECTEDEQCCDDLPCVYGRCDKKKKGDPGTICKKDKDCGEGCCVLEPTISEDHGICKVKLKEFHQCSPVLFRKVWVGDEKPKCGPCEDDLECSERGLIASHLVCMKKKKS